jgi:predicted SAM-dependent methyltransferase
LGSGKIRWNGWVNIDLYSDVSDVKCDLRKLEFPDDYADVAVAVHVIEHFYEWEAQEVLAEWRRVLKPGGKIVLELPSMNKVFNYIRDAMNAEQQLIATFSWFAIWGDPREKSAPMCHKWGYTKQMIKDKLIASGFKDIAFESPNYHFPSRDMRVVGYK